MNHLVFLDRRAGELEKILSGIKTMLVKEFMPAAAAAQPVRPGDSLYFLRDKDECDLRVAATVVRVFACQAGPGEDLSQPLKELQARLQLTEDQYNYWSVKQQVLLVEFEAARKIPLIEVAPQKIENRSDWIAFEAFDLVT
jgi:hypothetical protein